MKKYKQLIIGFLIGIIVATTIGVSATILYDADEIGFTPTNPNWNVDNLESALNDLYDNEKKSATFTFQPSSEVQNFDLGFKPNYIDCVIVFPDYYYNVTYNKDIDDSNVIRSNGSRSGKVSISEWFSLNDNGVSWLITQSTWHGKDAYCFASK